LIVSSLANNLKYSKYIVQNAGDNLIQELKLQQPNNHYLAYIILKKISNKNYSDRDYKSWQNWLTEAKYV
jgi:hypothetical protein